MLTLFTSLANTLAMCPSCKDGLAGSDQWAQGFNVSIMFMMAMPFMVVAVVGGAVYRSRRRAPLPKEPDA